MLRAFPVPRPDCLCALLSSSPPLIPCPLHASISAPTYLRSRSTRSDSSRNHQLEFLRNGRSAFFEHLKPSRPDSTVSSHRRSENGVVISNSATAKNQQLSGVDFVVPKSTVFGTIVLLRTYGDTYTVEA